MTTRDVLFSSILTQGQKPWFKVTPQNGREPTWWQDAQSAMNHARRLAKASGGNVIRRIS